MAFDSATYQQGYASSLSCSHTVGSGADRRLFVFIAYSGTGDKIAGVTFGGVALTRLQFSQVGPHASAIYALDDPASGTDNAVATFTGAGTYAMAAASVDGVAGATTYKAEINAFQSSGSTIAVTSGSGDLVIDFAYTSAVSTPTLTSPAGQDSRLSGVAHKASSKVAATVGSQTMATEWSGGEQLTLHRGIVAIPQSGGGGGAPPTGTVTIGTITPSSTSASVPYSYSASDQTGFEYRLDSGTATALGASPATISGLTASTAYSIEIRAINAAGDGAWSAVANFTTSAANTNPSFDGPNISDISGTESVALSSLDVSSRFSDTESAMTFSAVGSWPAGVTVSSAGVISGTPTTAGTYAGLQVRATDAGSLTADSNTFSITVAAAAVPSVTVTDPLKNNTGTVLASQSGVRVAVLQAADLVSVYEATGLTTNASGMLSAITDAAIVTGQQYHVAIKLADGSVGITGPITAS